MAWDIRKTYYYLVCFATLLMVLIGAVQVVHRVLDLALPREAYAPSRIDLYERFRGRMQTGPGEEVPYTRAELEQMAREEAARFQREQRRNDLRNLFGSLAMVVIAGPVYLFHWRKVRRDGD
jgi:hypothetical protein